MLRLWAAWRNGGMGRGHLPESGGSGEQAALMWDAFHIMDAASMKLDKEEEDRRRGR